MNNELFCDTEHLRRMVTEAAWDEARCAVSDARGILHSRNGKGSEFLGWLDLPSEALESAHRITTAANEIIDKADTLVVVGIGGSYLGARAVIEACSSPFKRAGVEVLYAGQHINGPYLKSLLEYLDGREFCVNVISKSGTTTEPAIAFRVLKAYTEKRYGVEEARHRIFATTDRERGALRKLADGSGYTTFTIPDDVGGRFSVLSPVGLLPIAAAGVDVESLCRGAEEMRQRLFGSDMESNPAFAYATARTAMYRSGKSVEILASFEPAFAMICEWWKQLFGECEGKNGRGIFPASVTNTTDLHSLGQYIQDGSRIMFESFLVTQGCRDDLVVPRMDDDLDGLNYLADRPLHDINRQAWLGTAEAHENGGVPGLTISIPDVSAGSIGALLYFFEYAAALSGYALGINPFDQPGVEEYKKNMFRLLGKPA